MRWKCVSPFGSLVVCLSACLLALAPDAARAEVLGQRVFSAGHSFHTFVPGLLREMAQGAKIQGHVQVGTQGLGGSRVEQHWNLPDEKNKAKEALATGKVDVLTLSPIYLPDDGIENYVKLALEHNPNVRVLVQEFWLPFDVYAPDYQKKRPEPVDRNTRTGETMRAEHAPYFKSFDEHLAALNKKYEKPVLHVVPTGQAAIALREKIIAGQTPGLQKQEDLFTDAIGHASPPLQALVAYCHYAVIYRQSPVGLPAPSILTKKEPAYPAELIPVLQSLAWETVLEHPLSGVKAETKE